VAGWWGWLCHKVNEFNATELYGHLQVTKAETFINIKVFCHDFIKGSYRPMRTCFVLLYFIYLFIHLLGDTGD
jgi:hypothetical protein